MIFRALAVLLSLALPAAAERIISPEEFEAMSQDKTLYFTQNGAPYGVERYYEDRQSTWQYEDGSCIEGRWFPVNDTICFVYENAPLSPQCWIFAERGGNFYARTDGTPAGALSELRLAGEDTKALNCNAPDLGVKFAP